jgi:hypothetical protein
MESIMGQHIVEAMIDFVIAVTLDVKKRNPVEMQIEGPTIGVVEFNVDVRFREVYIFDRWFVKVSGCKIFDC